MESQKHISFEEWIKVINVNSNHFDFLLENNIVSTIQFIFEETITNITNQDKSIIIPIKCFSQKINLFYILDQRQEWRQIKFEDFTKLLGSIQYKLLNALSRWKELKKDEISNSDSLSILYNKTIIKIMNMNIGVLHDPISNKIKSNLYNYLKIDLKNLIEYEFEF